MAVAFGRTALFEDLRLRLSVALRCAIRSSSNGERPTGGFSFVHLKHVKQGVRAKAFDQLPVCLRTAHAAGYSRTIRAYAKKLSILFCMKKWLQMTEKS